MLLDLLIFGFFIFLFFYIPGYQLLLWAQLKNSASTQTSLSFLVGSSLFILISFVVRYFSLPFWTTYFYAAGMLFISWPRVSCLIYSFLKIKLDLFKILFICTVVLLTISLAAMHLDSGIFDGEFKLTAVRDSLWRLSIISEITHSFPPQIPGFSGELLKNYHFLYDFLIASTHLLTKISIVPLYFRYFTLFSAAVLVLSIYSVLQIFVKNKWIILFGTILTVFTGNISYVLPFLSSRYAFLYQSNIFMSDQPFDQSHNPFNLFAYALFLGVILLLAAWERRENWKTFLLVSIAISILPGVKIYAGILAFMALAIVVVYRMIIKRRLLLYAITPAIIALPVLLSMKGKGFSILSFSPGWLLAKMIQDHDRLFLEDMFLKEQYYRQTGNVFRLAQSKITQLGIYLVGNLNIRVLTLGLFFKKAHRQITSINALIFVLAASVFSLGIPLFFSQTRGVYDSIQFSPYGLLLLSIVSILVIERIFNQTHKRFRIIGSGIFLLGVLSIAVPTNIFLLKSRIFEANKTISRAEVSALAFLQNTSSNESIILTDLSKEKLENMYIPALSGRRVFLSGSALSEQVGVDTRKRKEEIELFFTYDPKTDSGNLHPKHEFLQRNNISYIYLSKSGLKHNAFIQLLGLPVLYENPEVVIYEVI